MRAITIGYATSWDEALISYRGKRNDYIALKSIRKLITSQTMTINRGQWRKKTPDKMAAQRPACQWDTVS